MRALLVIAVVLFLAIGVIGFNRGWFVVTTQEQPNEQVDVHLRVDQHLIHQDVEKVKQEAKDIIK